MLADDSAGWQTSQCGMIAVDCTSTSSDVTCRTCLRLMQLYGPPPPSKPFQPSGPYKIVPQTWDRRGQAIVDASLIGRREKRYRWPDIESALREYCATIVDGYGAKSWAASLARFGKYGTIIAVSTHGIHSEPQHRADGAAMVEKALRFATGSSPYADRRTERGIILARLVGAPMVDKEYRRHGIRAWCPLKAAKLAELTGLTTKQIGAIIRHGRQFLRIDLCARGLVPAPKHFRDDIAARRRMISREP